MCVYDVPDTILRYRNKEGDKIEKSLSSLDLNSGGYNKIDRISHDFYEDAHLQFKLSLTKGKIHLNDFLLPFLALSFYTCQSNC